MGMYTEFHFNAELNIEKDGDVARVLKHMLTEEPTDCIPDHRLFNTERWKYMLISDSYYFDADTHSTLRWDDTSDHYYLCIRCNLKNYDSEIECFLDWIHQYLECYDMNFLGFYRYEEEDVPTLLYYYQARIMAIIPALAEAEGKEE